MRIDSFVFQGAGRFEGRTEIGGQWQGDDCLRNGLGPSERHDNDEYDIWKSDELGMSAGVHTHSWMPIATFDQPIARMMIDRKNWRPDR